jgi:hypothetical protein
LTFGKNAPTFPKISPGKWNSAEEQVLTTTAVIDFDGRCTHSSRGDEFWLPGVYIRDLDVWEENNTDLPVCKAPGVPPRDDYRRFRRNSFDFHNQSEE